MSIDPIALRNVLALASDHLRGTAMPPIDTKTMVVAWSQIASLEAEYTAMTATKADVKPPGKPGKA